MNRSRKLPAAPPAIAANPRRSRPPSRSHGPAGDEAGERALNSEKKGQGRRVACREQAEADAVIERQAQIDKGQRSLGWRHRSSHSSAAAFADKINGRGGHKATAGHRCNPAGPSFQWRAHHALRRRSALAVTRTVAPVSARMAGHSPVMPAMVVTRNIGLEAERNGDVLADVTECRPRECDERCYVRPPGRSGWPHRPSPRRHRYRHPWRCRRWRTASAGASLIPSPTIATGADLFQYRDLGQLILRQEVSFHVEAKFRRNRLACAAIVTGQHHATNAQFPQGRDAGSRVRAWFVPDCYGTQCLGVPRMTMTTVLPLISRSSTDATPLLGQAGHSRRRDAARRQAPFDS